MLSFECNKEVLDSTWKVEMSLYNTSCIQANSPLNIRREIESSLNCPRERGEGWRERERGGRGREGEREREGERGGEGGERGRDRGKAGEREGEKELELELENFILQGW